MKRWCQLLLVALLLAAVARTLWIQGRLPERVATHFDAAGKPNGWMSRGAHTALQLATFAFVAALAQGLAYGNSRLPKEYLNIPRRDYWLAPERAAATHDWMGAMILLMGCTLLAFFLGVFQLVYRANLAPAPQLDLAIWYLAAGLLVTDALLLALLVGRFLRAPAAA